MRSSYMSPTVCRSERRAQAWWRAGMQINTGTSVSETGGLVLRVTTAFLEETLRGDETEFVDALRDLSSEEDGVTIRTGTGE